MNFCAVLFVLDSKNSALGSVDSFSDSKDAPLDSESSFGDVQSLFGIPTRYSLLSPSPCSDYEKAILDFKIASSGSKEPASQPVSPRVSLPVRQPAKPASLQPPSRPAGL